LLAVRLPNWVGDVCMALPALTMLAGRRVQLHCFGRGWAPDLLAGLPMVVSPLPAGMGAAARALRASGAAKGLLFTNSLSGAVQMRLAGVAATGYRRGMRGLLLGRAIERSGNRHEAESFWHVAQAALGASDAQPVPFTRLPLTAQHRRDAAQALGGAGVAPPYTVVCPLAVGSAAGNSKVWPHFGPLVRRLIAGGRTVVVCPGPGEAAAAAAGAPGAVMLDGLGLGAYAAVLAGAAAVIANDSGPMHLAAVAGAPVLGIFGPSDPARTRPWSATGVTIGGCGDWPVLEAVLAAVGSLPAPVRSE
jgi:heptosyltransferase-2